MRKITTAFSLLISIVILSGCEGYFGEKTDVDFIEIPEFTTRQAAYVPIQPILNDFNYPTDIVAGLDNLVYIVDAGSEEIISMDESGRILGSFHVPGVTKIAQDRSFDILAIGTKDTTIANTPYTLSCIYRIDLKGILGYGINNARITNEIVHPFYFKNSFSSNDAITQFTGIAFMSTNEFYVTRKGERNNNNQFGGPDNAVLLFDEDDNYVTPISISSGGALYSDFFKSPEAIICNVVHPQLNITDTRDFMVVVSGDETEYKFREIIYSETDFGVDYIPANNVGEDTSQADGFITEANKFINPVDISVSGDGSNYIFITDTETDSLYQFTGTGLEGVQPPAGANSTKYVKVSFGGEGIGATQFNNPMGAAYMNEILYVADAGNGRVLRFKLTLDFD